MKIENKGLKRLFCDSQLAFDTLVANGLVDPNIQVLTRSFVLSNNQKVNTDYLDGRLSVAKRLSLKSKIKCLQDELNRELQRADFQGAHRLIFLQFWNSFQNDILDAILLCNDYDFGGTTIISVPRTGRPEIDQVLKPAWIDWFATCETSALVDVSVPYHNERAPRGEVVTSLRDRLMMVGFSGILWKIAKLGLLPDLFFRADKIGVIGQTELLRDAVIECLFDGCKPNFIEKPLLSNADIEPDIILARNMFDECEQLIQQGLALISNKFLRARASQIFIERLALDLGKYRFLLNEWQFKLSAYPDLRCILTGFGKGPEALSLATACRARGIRIAAFQHGITREILSNVEERSVFFETSFCDVFFTMNPTAAAVTKYYSIKQPVSVVAKNWPSPFKRLTEKPKKSSKPILFVSTNLYSGHRPNGLPPMSDGDLCNLEMGLVERVFGCLDLKIDYKPYPAIRQLDPDPVLSAVKRQRNMSVVGSHRDLRYLLSWYGMFITTKATSTVSWIVATGKPLLFIDHYCHARLSNDARDAFSKSFFLVDQRDVDFESRLKTFLERPFDEILEEWDSKSLQRLQTIEKFFGGKRKSQRNQIFDDIKHYCLNI